ncbi:MAG TPA: hypothetical protein VIU12_27250 [Chryseolinea sp.]
MKNKMIVTMLLMVVAIVWGYAQELPPKHRGMHPTLRADGTVVDEAGNPLGSIKNGKACDVTGQVIGVIAAHGDVMAANGKGIGKIQKDGSFKSMKGHVVTTDPDGVVKVAGKEVAKVEAGYKEKSHGCALHCFYSAENSEAMEIDKSIKP